QYLAARAGRTDLWPQDAAEQADVSRWQLWTHTQWAPPLGVIARERLMKRMLGQGPPDEAAVADKLTEFSAHARLLDQHLSHSPWLAAGRFTLAEVSVACTLTWWRPTALPLHEHPHLTAWFERIQELPSWKETELPAMR